MRFILIVISLLLCYYFYIKYVKFEHATVIYNDSLLVMKYNMTDMTNYENNNIRKKPLSKINKICFATYDDRHEEYISLHNKSVLKYCEINPTFTYHYEYEKANINPYWYKMYLVYKLLVSNKYDYVFWMDSDSIINNFEFDLNKLLNSYDSDIFITIDGANNASNAGLFIIKASPIGITYMEDVLSHYEKSGCVRNDGTLKGAWALSCYEQGVMNQYIIDKYHKHTTLLSRDEFFNEGYCNREPFISHLYGSSTESRNECFRQIPPRYAKK